jgi:hypothetical protein
LEEELEVDGTVPESLLRDELWICGDALEDFLGLGTRHAWPFHYSNNRELEESPQHRWMKYYSE